MDTPNVRVVFEYQEALFFIQDPTVNSPDKIGDGRLRLGIMVPSLAISFRQYGGK